MSFYLMHRGWLDHPAFGNRKREPFCRAAAWAWLIDHAVFDATRVRIAGKIVTLGRGQLSYSLRFLGDAWGWGHERCRRFLRELHERGMVVAVCETGQMVITICNYGIYQDGAKLARQPARHERDSSETNTKEGKEGEATLGLSESEETESVAARDADRPPSAAEAEEREDVCDSPDVRLTPPPQAPPPEPIRSIKKKQLVQKCCRYVNDTLHGAEKMGAILGLMGEDPEHDAQWWLDTVDRHRKRAGWDDMRGWKQMAGLMPAASGQAMSARL